MERTIRYVCDYLATILPLEYPNKSPFVKHNWVLVKWKDLHHDTYACVPYQNYGFEIHLNYNYKWSQEMLIELLAHEWRHIWQGLQRPKYYRWCTNRLKTGYYNNPEEVDAREFGTKVLEELLNDPNFPWWE